MEVRGWAISRERSGSTILVQMQPDRLILSAPNATNEYPPRIPVRATRSEESVL